MEGEEKPRLGAERALLAWDHFPLQTGLYFGIFWW